MNAVDRARLITWLELHALAGGLVAYAIYTGLAARVRRGEFDTEVLS